MKPAAYLLVAIVLIGFGLYRQFLQPTVTDEERARCEQAVRDAHPGDEAGANAILIHCDQPSMVAMMEAELGHVEAQRTAAAIAASHHRGLTFALINFALIGAGLGSLAAGAVAMRKGRA